MPSESTQSIAPTRRAPSLNLHPDDERTANFCATPEQNLVASIISKAIDDLKVRRTRGKSLWWLTDSQGTCPAYCALLKIDHGRLTAKVRMLAAAYRLKATRSRCAA